MKISPAVPVIGPLFYRRHVREIADAAKRGDSAAVRTLCALARTCPDLQVKAIAFDALNCLPAQEAIDVFCNEILAWEDPVLEKIAVNRGYLPEEPGTRALFLWISGQYERLYRFDRDAHLSVLARGYGAAPETVKARALRYAADPSDGQYLAHALMGIAPLCTAETWSYGEWKVIISALTTDRSWDELWQLVGFAPPSLAVTALNAIKVAGWRPAGDSRQVFEELACDLPEAWTYPAPEKPLQSITVRNSQCLRLAFSRDGTLLAAGDGEGKIRIWQTSSGRLVTTFTPCAGPVRFLSFAPDNSFLVSGTGTGTLACSGIPSGDTIWSYADGGHTVSSVELSANGEELIAGTEHGGILLLRCRTGALQPKIKGNMSRVTAIAPSPDGRSTAIGHTDGTICCRDPHGTDLCTAPGTGDAVRALAYAEEGNLLFIVYERSLPALRDMSTGARVRTFDGRSGHPVCYALSTEHQITIIGGDDHVLRFWDWTKRTPTIEIPHYNRLPVCCALTPDGSLAVACCNEGTVYYYRVCDGRRIREFRGFRQAVTACAVSPDGTLLASAGGDGAVTLRGIPSGELIWTLAGPGGAVTALDLTTGAGGTGIVAGTADGRACIFSVPDGMPVSAIDLYTPSVQALAVSPDGTYLACAGRDTSLRIWELTKGGLVATCEGLATTVRCLAFLPDSSGFISGGWDGAIRIWDVPGGKLVRVLAGHSSIVTCCCADPKGRVLVTGSNDTTLRLWPLTGGKECIVIRDTKHEVSACAISPDGTLLAAAGPDPLIRLYHLPEGNAAGTITQVPGKPTGLSFTSDGLVLAVGYDSGILAFYEVHGHGLIRTLPAHSGAVTGIAIDREGDCIVTSGADGTIRTFRVPFIRPLSQASLADLEFVREQVRAPGSGAIGQWQYLGHLLSLRFQNEIELCQTFNDAGQYDIQIVG